MTGASKTGNMVTTDTPVRISDAWNIGQGSEAKPIDTIDVTPGATPLREYKVRADHPIMRLIEYAMEAWQKIGTVVIIVVLVDIATKLETIIKKWCQ